MTISDLVKKYAELEDRAEEQKAKLKAINDAWAEVETKLLEAMAEEGIKSTKLEGLGRFSLVTKNYLSVTAANKPSFFDYLKASGNGALLKEDVNPKTLTAFLKGHLEEIIKEFSDKGMDTVDARNKALEFLNQKGASYFSERVISHTKE
jgi:hypothetical protein